VTRGSGVGALRQLCSGDPQVPADELADQTGAVESGGSCGGFEGNPQVVFDADASVFRDVPLRLVRHGCRVYGLYVRCSATAVKGHTCTVRLLDVQCKCLNSGNQGGRSLTKTLERSPCTMLGCTRPSHARNLCHTHYMRRRRHGDPNVSLINREHADTCSVDGCERPYRASGLCFMHWQRKQAHGDVGSVEPLSIRYQHDSTCAVDGCERRPRRNWLCEMHADRLDDHGNVGGPEPLRQPPGSGHARDDGYVEVRCPDEHPLSRGGRTLRHRLGRRVDVRAARRRSRRRPSG
jgi:hypothetical protein